MPYSTIAKELAIPAIGSIFGSIFGNSRDDKRASRQQYRDALIGAGVRSSLVGPWHSDEHEAGQTLIQLAQQPKGVEFLNKYMPSRITRSSVQSLPNQYQNWISNQSSGIGGSVSSPVSTETITKSLPVLGLIGGLAYWGLK